MEGRERGGRAGACWVFFGGGESPSSRTRALDLDDVFRHVDELVDETLAVHFGQNTALIVISVGGARAT